MVSPVIDLKIDAVQTRCAERLSDPALRSIGRSHYQV
jgi:hypothetical protein